MLERGEATAEDIDQAMELGTGHREWLFRVQGSSLARERLIRSPDHSHGGM